MISLCVIGYPLKHTLSPVMHNTALCDMGISGVYLALEVKPENLKEAVHGLSALGFLGYNVTIPHKVEIIQYLDGITEEAKLVGAVNTVIIYPSGKTMGDNIDIYGFMNSFNNGDKESLKGKKAVILGAGGASRAVGAGLIKLGVSSIELYDLKKEVAENTATIISKNTNDSVNIIGKPMQNLNIDDTSILINANPIGMHPNIDDSAFDLKLLEHLDPKAIVYDLIYNPLETKLLKTAASLGYKTYNGSEMLVLQGARALEKWTNETVPVDLMRQSLLEVLNNGW